jgi:hypothetical protein
MGFEPTTPTLARLCSTPELHPHPYRQVQPQYQERMIAGQEGFARVAFLAVASHGPPPCRLRL